MLCELRVRHLGVIEDQTLVIGPGMTVLTGETGAGKTLIVEAIDLLLGGRADPLLVRAGATEAVVEGRFATEADPEPPDASDASEPTDASGDPAVPASTGDPAVSEGSDGDGGTEGTEVVLARTVPAQGRARAYLDGRMASSAALGEAGAALVDIHGQHAHQSLLTTAAQRRALDRAGRVDLEALRAARAVERRLRAEQAELGGDGRARAREIDLLRFQLTELDAAGLDDPDEDAALAEEEALLGDAAAHRAAAGAVHDAVAADGGVADRLAELIGAVPGRGPLAEVHDRLVAAVAELHDLADGARRAADAIDEDPARLEAVSARRHQLAELRRKYGETLAEVIAFRSEVADRLEVLVRRDERAGALDAEVAAAAASRAAAEAAVQAARRRAAGPLARAIEDRLHDLALPRARFAIDVGDEAPGDEVEWRLAANPGEPALPVRRVASGGELARTMLAARLVLDQAAQDGGSPRRTLVFDEVDAGIGGEAAVAVGAALAELARHHQILVVTHLAQVAAYADDHLVVAKATDGDRTVAGVTAVTGDERVTELARMLSGRPDSDAARRHAAELLAGRPGPVVPAAGRRARRSGPTGRARAAS